MSQDGPQPERNRSVDRGTALVDFGAVLSVAAVMTAIIVVLATRSAGGDNGQRGTRAPNGAPIPTVNADLSEFNVTVSQFASAPAGDVTFVVKNSGGIDHEMIVLKTDTPFNKLPIADAGDPPAPVKTGADKVDEGTNVGETGDPNLKPGQTRTFTIKHLAAGRYVLLCNLAKHYGLGMRAAFTVT